MVSLKVLRQELVLTVATSDTEQNTVEYIIPFFVQYTGGNIMIHGQDR